MAFNYRPQRVPPTFRWALLFAASAETAWQCSVLSLNEIKKKKKHQNHWNCSRIVRFTSYIVTMPVINSRHESRWYFRVSNSPEFWIIIALFRQCKRIRLKLEQFVSALLRCSRIIKTSQIFRGVSRRICRSPMVFLAWFSRYSVVIFNFPHWNIWLFQIDGKLSLTSGFVVNRIH